MLHLARRSAFAVGVTLALALSARLSSADDSPLFSADFRNPLRAEWKTIGGRWNTNEWTVVATLDGGRQDQNGTGAASWWGASLVTRAQTTERTAFSARVETFQDDNQVIAHTGVVDPFRAWGGSLGFDFEAVEGVVWRTEFRGLLGKDAIFQDRGSATGFGKSNTVFVTSLAVTF